MQPEGYSHDYSAIETRLRQLEAPAYRQRLIGKSILVFAVAAAICALILALAFAWRLVTMPNQVEKIVERVVPAPVATPQFPDIPETSADTQGIVTTNFTLFQETEISLDGQIYFVTTGHKYLSETDTIFSSAWCYTYRVVDDIEIKIALGDLEPGEAPVLRRASPQTLAQTGLSRTDHAGLFDACPWLSGNPNVGNSAQSVEPGSKA